ncbi:MAG: YciI family protein [Mycobacterium sp.]
MFHVLKINYEKPIDVIDQTRPAHLEWLADEVAAGRILLAGRQESGAGGVLITGDISAEDAQDIIDRDPYTVAGVVSYERLSFNGGIRAPGL